MSGKLPPMGHNARMSLRRSVAYRGDKFGAGSTEKRNRTVVPITLRRADYEASKAAEAESPQSTGVDMTREPRHLGPRK